MTKHKGEIVTVLTVGAFVVLTVASIISSAFINQSKQTTKTSAQTVMKCPGGSCAYCGKDGWWDQGCYFEPGKVQPKNSNFCRCSDVNNCVDYSPVDGYVRTSRNTPGSVWCGNDCRIHPGSTDPITCGSGTTVPPTLPPAPTSTPAVLPPNQPTAQPTTVVNVVTTTPSSAGVPTFVTLPPARPTVPLPPKCLLGQCSGVGNFSRWENSLDIYYEGVSCSGPKIPDFKTWCPPAAISTPTPEICVEDKCGPLNNKYFFYFKNRVSPTYHEDSCTGPIIQNLSGYCIPLPTSTTAATPTPGLPLCEKGRDCRTSCDSNYTERCIHETDGPICCKPLPTPTIPASALPNCLLSSTELRGDAVICQTSGKKAGCIYQECKDDPLKRIVILKGEDL